MWKAFSLNILIFIMLIYVLLYLFSNNEAYKNKLLLFFLFCFWEIYFLFSSIFYLEFHIAIASRVYFQDKEENTSFITSKSFFFTQKNVLN